MILGLTTESYLALRRYNLCTDRWSMPSASQRAREVFAAHPGRAFVLLGRKVGAAFAGDTLDVLVNGASILQGGAPLILTGTVDGDDIPLPLNPALLVCAVGDLLAVTTTGATPSARVWMFLERV